MESIIFKYIALIICLVGFVLWHVCLRLKEPPVGGAETGKVMFAVGLLVVLLK